MTSICKRISRGTTAPMAIVEFEETYARIL
jgi:hypothetical protein